MASVVAPTAVARVFIACPGDLAQERSTVSRALEALNREPAFAGHVEFVPYAYENVVPARSGMDPEEVVTSYLLRPEDADLLICLFWRRMGTPLAKVIDPTTNAPYQSGTEYEYLTAYAAAQTKPAPLILLYRCQKAAPPPATTDEQAQLAHVNAFFARFNPGGDLLGLTGTFTDDYSLIAALQRDLRALLPDLLAILTQRTQRNRSPSAEPTKPIVFGLPPLPSGFVPRPESVAALRKALLGSHQQVGVVAATALHGQGGLGKTVLARAAWEDQTIQAAFPDGVLWATVGQHVDAATVERIQREWIRALGGDYTQVTDNAETGRSEIARLVGERAFLLVLDDIWQASAVKALAVTGARCRILLTTRFLDQVDDATPISLELLTPTQCRELLRKGIPNQPLDDATLDAIAQRVERLPLALKIIAGLLLQRHLTWPDILRELNAGHLANIALAETRDKSIFAAIDTGVRFLPTEQQARYRELFVFPTDVPLNDAAVARLWAHTGGLSAFVAKKLLGEFQARSLIQADNTLHDLQVDYLRAIVPTEEIRTLHSALCDAYSTTPDFSSAPLNSTRNASPWSTLPTNDDLYAWRFLATHLSHAHRYADLAFLLTDLTYLEGKLARLGVAATVTDLNLLSEVAPVRQAASVISAGTRTLSKHPDELVNQLSGRGASLRDFHHVFERAQPYFCLYTPSLKQADAALLRVLTGHRSWVRACAFSPDGRYALSASQDSTLRLWDIASGQELRRFNTSGATACAFSPDGRYALSASVDKMLRLWDVASGQEVRQFTGHTSGVKACAFSPDGRFVLSASFDKTLRLWDIASGRELRQFVGHTDEVKACAFSPDGRYALSASEDKTLRLWDIASGQELRQFTGHTDPVTGCAFSPDGCYALSADGRMQLWDIASGQELRRFNTSGATACAFSPDGRYALSASVDKMLRLWEVGSGQEVRRFTGHTSTVNACAFSPDGRSVLSAAGSYSATEDNTLRLWDIASGQDARQFTFTGHTSEVKACAFSPDGRFVLSASVDKMLRLWEVGSGQEVRRFTITGHTRSVTACAFSPDGRFVLSASGDATLRLWDIASGQELRQFVGHTDEVKACAFSPDGRSVLSAAGGIAAFQDKTLRLWEVGSGQEVRRFTGHTSAVTGCAFSPDGRTTLSASRDKTLRLWDIASGQELRQFVGHTGPVTGCAFSPDGRYALSASFDKTLRLWDIASGQEVRRFIGHSTIVGSCAFSPDGRYALSAADDGHDPLSTGDDRTLRLWEVTTGARKAVWCGEADITCCAFSPLGDRVMAADKLGGTHLFMIVGLVVDAPSAALAEEKPKRRRWLGLF